MKVADIFEDPVVNVGEMHIYATHTKHFPVRGSGFDTLLNGASPPVLVIDGISANRYKIQVRYPIIFCRRRKLGGKMLCTTGGSGRSEIQRSLRERL